MILHYSLAILNTNDNALSLLFFANAPMSDSYIGTMRWEQMDLFGSFIEMEIF